MDFTAFERTRNSTPLQSLTTMAIIALDCPIAASTLNLIVLVAGLDKKQGLLTSIEELEIVLTLECPQKF